MRPCWQSPTSVNRPITWTALVVNWLHNPGTAASHGLLVMMELQRAEEDAAIASGNLAQLLRLDQSVMLESPPAPLELVVLTPLDTDLGYLVDMAHARRPEVKANGAAIGAAEARVKQEIVRPWLPTLSIGFSGGGFGGAAQELAR